MSTVSPRDDSWDDDETLMGALDDALHGAVSDRARIDARAAFAWRTIDEDLMRLAHDSAVDEAVLVRSATATPRVVGFHGSDFTLEIELDAGILMGQVVPPRVCRVATVTPAGEQAHVDTDESGIFSLATPDAGPVRFTVTYDGLTQSTEWLTL